MDPELRRSPRYPFFAAAEITELQTKTRFKARTSDLSRFGCYMDMMNPFPQGTSINIQITSNQQTFQVPGHVVYSQPHMGMGVAFEEVAPGQSGTLEKWLADLGGNP